MRYTCVMLSCMAGCAAPGAIDESKVVDLTYAFNAESVYWPTARQFELTRAAWGRNEAGLWYASNDFSASEHGGTHLDAPIHFAEGAAAVDDLHPMELAGEAVLIDPVYEQARRDGARGRQGRAQV